MRHTKKMPRTYIRDAAFKHTCDHCGKEQVGEILPDDWHETRGDAHEFARERHLINYTILQIHNWVKL